MVALDDGDRLDYLYDVINRLQSDDTASLRGSSELGRIAANWILHELGGLLSTSGTAFSSCSVPAQVIADIIINLLEKSITGRTAKTLLSMVFDGDSRAIDAIIKEENIGLQVLSVMEYQALAGKVIADYPGIVEKIKEKGQRGKLQFIIGQMIRRGEGRVEAGKAEAVLCQILRLEQ